MLGTYSVRCLKCFFLKHCEVLQIQSWQTKCCNFISTNYQLLNSSFSYFRVIDNSIICITLLEYKTGAIQEFVSSNLNTQGVPEITHYSKLCFEIQNFEKKYLEIFNKHLNAMTPKLFRLEDKDTQLKANCCKIEFYVNYCFREKANDLIKSVIFKGFKPL